MTTVQVLVASIIGLAVSEFSEICPWLARKLVQWSARRHYAPASRAALRAEELTAFINDRPGKLFKLITALGFASVAIVTRKAVPAVEPLKPLWQPAKPTVLVHYMFFSYGEGLRGYRHPNTRAVRQAWRQLTKEVRDVAREVGVAGPSWRRCIKKLRRITGDDRWTLVENNLDFLERINRSPLRVMRSGIAPIAFQTLRFYIYQDSTITHYQAAIDTARVEIRRLGNDFLSSAAPR
ncbi:MAG: hypothetical protein ACRES5_13795 [Pseudomonas sp.]